MGRSMATIRNVPFRQIVDRTLDEYQWVETLSCGHKLRQSREDHHATKRRCYECEAEQRALKQVQKLARKNVAESL